MPMTNYLCWACSACTSILHPLVFGEFLRTPSKVKMQRNGFRHARPSHPNQWLGILIDSTLNLFSSPSMLLVRNCPEKIFWKRSLGQAA